ncbi:hypothetical protein ACFSAV_00880 [Pasteurella oralis]|uniref:Lipoprotein n=1 Tax=Pasteurella oralis TaxID=1071947 RepID=A0ABW4NQQ0_9PAST|nr:hypothetical protein [Pasteurella oralis]MDO5055190.1 hypothetical protein [Pasteurella oralis]
MDKFSKISVITLFSLGLVACDQFINKDEKTQTNASVTHIQVDPKADFALFTEFQLAQNEKIATLNQQLVDILQSGDTKALETLLVTFSKEIDGIVKELDTLPIYSAEVLNLKEKAKILLITSSELMADNVKLQQNPSEAGGKALLVKRDVLLKITDEFTQMNNELAEKYGTPAVQ